MFKGDVSMKTATKYKSLVTTVVLALLVMISGTFAWSSISQRALNEKSGENVPLPEEIPGGRVHDDYDEASGNKDIYAENYGNQPLIVRVKLSEYFETEGQALVDGTVKADRNTWTPYRLPDTQAPTDAYREYVSWTLGGNKNYLPTFNTNPDSLATDAAGNAIDFETNGQTALGDGTHDYFQAGQEVSNPDDPSVAHVVKPTLTGQAPISMDDWLALPSDDKVGNFWVVDADGWAYWANPLQPDEATSLLLDQLTFNDEALGELPSWYYAIDVIGEFASLDDTDSFKQSENGQPSGNGESLIDELIKSAETFTYELKFTEDQVALTSGSQHQLTANVYQVSNQKPTPVVVPAELEWSVTGQETDTNWVPTYVSDTGLLTVMPFDGTRTLTVTVKSIEHGLEATLPVKTSTIQPGNEFYFFGETYLYLKNVETTNHLVVNKYVVANHSSTETYNDSELDLGMKSYYAGLSDEAKQVIQPVQTIFEVGMGGTYTGRDQLNMPDAPDDFATVTADGEKKAFALSAAEISDVSGPGKAFPTVPSRQSHLLSNPLETARWRLRTASNPSQGWVIHNASSAGEIGVHNYLSTYGSRPALIVKE